FFARATPGRPSPHTGWRGPPGVGGAPPPPPTGIRGGVGIGAAGRRSAPANTRDRNLVCFRGASEPVSRRRWIKRCTHARLTPNVVATSSASLLASHARATRSRRSIEYGAIATSPRTEKYHGHRTTYKSKPL